MAVGSLTTDIPESIALQYRKDYMLNLLKGQYQMSCNLMVSPWTKYILSDDNGHRRVPQAFSLEQTN